MLNSDQAAGLRQLFSAAAEPPGITFVGAEGRSAVVAEVARGLAGMGKEVIVIDERPAPMNVAAAFGAAARYDLMQAVNCDVPSAQVLLCAEPAIRIVPAARAARESARLDAAQRRAVADWLRRLYRNTDYVLVDSAGYARGVSLLQPPPQRVVIVATATSAGITEAYAQIKRLARESACRVFEVIVTQAPSRQAGETAFANMRDVARRHLAVRLELAACVLAREGGEAYGKLAESLLYPAYALREAQSAHLPPLGRGTQSLGFQHVSLGARGTPLADPVV